MDKEKERALDETPTWAVAVVCFVMLAISIFIEHVIHFIGHWLQKKNKPALYEALEKVKDELMLMGFISFALLLLQDPISGMCISREVASTWRPCDPPAKYASGDSAKSRNLRELSDSITRRFLATKGYNDCKDKNKVPFVSAYGIHQLHYFIFVLAIFHILQCIITLTLGRTKISMWWKWEDEAKTAERGPERFRFTRDTTFGRRHLNIWSKSSVSLWIACLFRQFYGSVTKVDYLTLRHGFITTHLAPGSQARFDFHEYIQRTLDEDFKVVVGISPTIWFFAVLFLLTYTDGWYSYLWLPFIPLIIILLVGAKLQMIISKMGLRIYETGEVVKGTPVVELGDHLFWFNNPRLCLNLIHLVLFQNAFQLAFLAWSSYAFKSIHSCFHKETANIVIRLTMGILIQVLCSYVTLPLYALVTQMGSSMKPTIFNDKVVTALENWHHTAKKHVKESKYSDTNTPLTSAPGTPTGGMSPVHLLHKHPRHSDSAQTSPRASNYKNDPLDLEEGHEIQMMQVGGSRPRPVMAQHESDVSNTEFSFGKNPQATRR